ncbi:MAG: SUMF1/EgtB/PvdO family nonheme iron enzyme [Planctomycetes bacterium]|nr:SUMF1/EgtB/PvdO family nonheme iron enzyme [Planctomycetota bacterium]
MLAGSVLLTGWILGCAGPATAGVFNPDVSGNGLTLDGYMIRVPGGGEPGGPVYTYRLGKYEITNQQCCDFLNDAERDAASGAPTRRSSNMYFLTTSEAAGTVYMEGTLTPFEYLCYVNSPSPEFDLTYDPAAAAGSRYQVKPGRAKWAARRLTWAGALKFCNWLTLDQGMSESQCCYTEGPHLGCWHPVTISTQDWWGKTPLHNDSVSAGRDLNDTERSDLVRRYRGYRLPMDDAGLLAGINRPYPNDFNEWLKAAAYDPNAPATLRTNAGGWQALPYHWMYGFGRETNTAADANWFGSGDPYEPGPAPVDFYDGTDHGGVFATNDTANAYGLYGLAGNVWEWCQDYGVSMDKRSVRGGSWISTPERQAASSCYFYGHVEAADISFGLRVLRVPGPKGDSDGDNDVDSHDVAHLAACLSGPAVAQTQESCQDAILDEDDDVDQEDFGLLQACMSGEDVLAPLECYR